MSTTPTAAAPRTTLAVGATLGPGEVLQAVGYGQTLTMQTDGNLVQRYLPATRADVLARLEVAALAAPEGAWVDAVGYDQRPLGRHLTRHDLDTVAHGRRLLLVHTSGHGHLVDSATCAGIAEPGGGWPGGVVRDARGAPTGLFLEDATELVTARRIP